MPDFTIAEIAAATGLDMIGDGHLTVGRACPPDQAGEGDLAVAMSETYAHALSQSAAHCAVVWQGADLEALGLKAALIAPRPRVALAGLTNTFQFDEDLAPGIHPTAAIDPTAQLGSDVWIGAFSTVGPNAVIGDHGRLAPHVTVGGDATLGDHVTLRAGVRIGARCTLGNDVLIHENAVIGADGFSFEPPQRGSLETARESGAVTASNTSGFLRIHSLAAVTIGSGVEIGACTTLDRGTLANTTVGDGSKIDNQVQIGHNVSIGSNCLLCAQVGVAGSARIGDRVILGGKVGVGDHIEIGHDSICAASTMVGTRVPPKSIMMGAPAAPRDQMLQQFMAIRRLPRLMEQVAEIRKTLGL